MRALRIALAIVAMALLGPVFGAFAIGLARSRFRE